MVVEELRDAFKNKYPQLEHDAIIKITADSDKDAKKVQSMITRFNKERLPNIVVPSICSPPASIFRASVIWCSCVRFAAEFFMNK